MYPQSFQSLIRYFSSLPSIGPKHAERLVLHLFKQNRDDILAFAETLRSVTDLHQCQRCFHIAENSLCTICSDTKRDPHQLCVVEDSLDLLAIERTGAYSGLYHVLGGTLEPGGNGSDTLTFSQLFMRLKNEPVEEVILATNPTTEGDMTALYLRQKLKDTPVRISRLARGLSTGGDIEYADEETLSNSLTNRREYS